MKKIERNNPCSCLSGKKYKDCCLSQSTLLDSFEHDLEWKNFRQIEGKIWEGAFAFANKNWGAEIIQDGWNAFCLGMDLEEESPDGKCLFPGWLIFRWIPFNYSEKWKHLGANLTIADLYLRKHSTEEHKVFLSAVDQSPFSFFFVEEVVPSKRLILKDLLLDRTVTIKEKMGSDPQLKGEVVFARLILLESQAFQISFGTTPLPVRYAMDILDVKQQILKKERKLTTETLMKYDDELRRAYLNFVDSVCQPIGFCNNDGDPILFCTLYYKLNCIPAFAFDQLAPLCKGEVPENILENGKFNRNNELKSIQFQWIKNKLTKLVLGNIKIEPGRLTIEVNSMERVRKIKKELKKRLPEAIFEKMETKSINEKESKEELSSTSPCNDEKEIIKEFVEKYYHDWLDKAIPVLNGKTPRQAVKTTQGRERLEFLLIDFEMSNQKKDEHLRIDVQFLRRELGLLHY